jgi:hypothetical protein
VGEVGVEREWKFLRMRYCGIRVTSEGIIIVRMMKMNRSRFQRGECRREMA